MFESQLPARAGRGHLGILLLCLCLFSTSATETGTKKFVLAGEVHLGSEGRLRGQRALVVLRGAHTPYFDQAWTTLGGRFKFKDLAAGVYVLSAQIRGFAISRASVDVSAGLADAKGRIFHVIVLQPDAGGEIGQVSVAELAVSSGAQRAYSKAEKLLRSGKVDQAVRQLEKALEKEPRFPRAHNLLGTIAYQQQEYQRAESHFRKALEADPRAYAPLVNLGGALHSLGRLEEALEVNRQAYKQRPDDPLVNAQLGLVYWGLGKTDAAIQFLNRARQQDPGHFSYPQLALAQIFLARGESEKARQELKEFLELHPDSEQAQAVRALLDRLASAPRRP